jgi:hypothetical protein
VSQEFVLGLLHVSKEVGKMHNAGGVGFPKFNSALGFENF